MAFQRARQSGFGNVNLDLMYGLVNQSMGQWQDTLQGLLALQPTHISLYALTLEEGTPLHRWVQQGNLPEPDQDLAADMYHHARGVAGRRRLPALRDFQLVQARAGVAAQPGLLAEPALPGGGGPGPIPVWAATASGT